MAIFGKTLGNGYAITAVLGTPCVMDEAQNTFISSTFWSERLGYAAALASLSVMEETSSWVQITKMGEYLQSVWHHLSSIHNVPITITGIPSLSCFSFNSPHNLKYKTLITQEMLKSGHLAANGVYLSLPHSHEVIDCYSSILDVIFATISRCESGDLDINEQLESPLFTWL